MFFYNMLLYNDFKQIGSFNVYGKDTKKYYIATVACCYLYPNEQSQANNYSAYQEVYEAEAHYVFGV